ncbi:hypothetical protein C499_14785 [Halogeometricum borinquense DSM 11551]|uniref:DUF7981 domain-containing protein n=1 Tax=Halogeometricum borinquense (strain ATCC 700274 / DSM 11551 / JCM 10706 / KCTC 4070 / PR3) TaxID=469382 RepID=L9UJ42_HALBP|nr:hypothetical protein C499_14785 [Halogeometricum borinquense DSM 11551]
MVGTLAFLVLVQGYRLVGGSLGLGIGATVGIAVVIAVVVGIAAYATESRLATKGRT